jgi:hypothetical protein
LHFGNEEEREENIKKEKYQNIKIKEANQNLPLPTPPRL